MIRSGLAIALALCMSACIYEGPSSSAPLGPVSADSYYQGLCEARAEALQSEADATVADGFEPAIDWLTEQCTALGFDMTSGPTEAQTETFGTLTQYIGNAYKGISNGDGEEPITDFQYWSWALGGTAILIEHVIADGSYGGDTYVYKDAKSGKLVYVYITNAGYRSEGEIQLLADGGFAAEETVTGHDTITRVRSTSIPKEDGTTVMTSQYLDAGTWVPGAGFTYSKTDEPLPVLKAKVKAPDISTEAETAPQ